MSSEEFITRLNQIQPGSETAAAAWMDWSKYLEELDSSHYELPTGSYKTREVFYDEFADLFDQVLSDHGQEVAQKVITLGDLPCCLFPWEVKLAAEHLANGGDIHDIPDMAKAGTLEDAYEGIAMN